MFDSKRILTFLGIFEEFSGSLSLKETKGWHEFDRMLLEFMLNIRTFDFISGKVISISFTL
jgi:hypothetical protein